MEAFKGVRPNQPIDDQARKDLEAEYMEHLLGLHEELTEGPKDKPEVFAKALGSKGIHIVKRKK